MTIINPAWYAVYTRSRHEKQVELQLRRNAMETYLPLRRTWSTRQDRRVLVDVPALPGYLFVHCALWPETRALVKRASSVIRLVESVGRPAVIPPEQVASLRRALEHSTAITPAAYLQVGERVRVTRGPLLGVEGVLARVAAGQHRLVLNVDFVHQAVAIQIDARDVEPVDLPRRLAS